MGKRLIITEEEKSEIKKMYNLDEGLGKKLLDKIKQKGLDWGKKIFKKVTGEDVDDITIEDLENLNFKQKSDLEKEMEPINHSIKNGDVVTVVNGDNRGMSFKVILVDGNDITIDLGHGETYDYNASDLRVEPQGTQPSHGSDPCAGAADPYLCYREQESKGVVFPKTSSTFNEFGNGKWKGVYKDF